MVANNVSAYFHGHDHQFVYETRDGIVYQEVPSPSMTGSGFSGIYTVGNYTDYQTISILPNAGHLRVKVTPDCATVEYVRSNIAGVSSTYTIAPHLPGDFSNPADSDVDGSDLAELIAYYPGLLDITTFAQDFGKTACP
jgi:hypothetical protein